MFLKLLIFLITAFCFTRTVSYGISCFKTKNVIGGISVILLAVIAAISVIFII